MVSLDQTLVPHILGSIPMQVLPLKHGIKYLIT